MAQFYQYMPELDGEEAMFIESLIRDWDEGSTRDFANIYRSRRKDPQTILIMALIGFFGFAGIHRFMLEQIGMGILYLLTGGLCWIGTIVDLVNYRKMTMEYNVQKAQEVAMMLKAQKMI